MRIGEHRATRIHGTLTIDLADGRTGEIDVDIDVEDYRTIWGVDYQYGEGEGYGLPLMSSPRFFVPQTTIYSLSTPTSLRREEPTLTIRLPTT